VCGIEFSNCQQFLVITNGHYNDIGRCTFDKNKMETTWMGSWVHESSTYNRIHDCTFSRFGWVSNGDDKGAILDIGYDTSTTDATNYNIVENNLFLYGGHHILQICGMNNVVRGNYLHNEAWMECERDGGCGNRNAMTIGPMAGRNLFEDNRFAFAGNPPDDNGANGFSIRSPDNIVRRNMCYGNGAAGIAFASMTVSIPTGNMVYNNTLYHNGYSAIIDHFWTGGIAFGNWGNGPMPGNTIVNNILHDNLEGKSVTGYGEAGPQNIHDNWMDEGDPGFMDGTLPTDTSDASLPDFRLKAESPCIDKGVFLTTVTSADGAGTRFAVENAGYFFDGWGIPGETGDTIQFEGYRETAVITNVDYDGNVITVDRALTWKRGLGVSLAYAGTSPDMGAHEFRSTSLNIDRDGFQSDQPESFGAMGNYPNPFNPGTTIRFDLTKESDVSLTVYTATGQLMDRLIDNTLPAGSHRIGWQPRNASAGVYLYVLDTSYGRKADKMLYMK
jgi:hypothetical protein